MVVIKTVKVMLVPNNKQRSKMFKYSNTSRYIYNWTLEQQKTNYENGGNFISDGDLRKKLTQLKKTQELNWLNEVSNDVIKQSVKDACNSYKRFFKGYSKYPKFKSKKKTRPSFYQDNCKIKFTDTHVKFEGFSSSKKKNKQKLNWVRLAEHGRIPIDCKYYNPRVTFDGVNWWISVGIECDDSTKTPTNEGIGIDLGIKDLAICSDRNTYKNINKTSQVKKLNKKKKRLQKQISRKYEMNKIQNENGGVRYCKTNNIKKLEYKLLKLNHRISNIRNNYQHHITSEIIKREPSFISLENLNIQGMMKNKHLAKSVQEQGLYEFKRKLSYKSEWNNIIIIDVPRFFPSSKTCSCCGSYKSNLKLSDRTYKCDNCGVEIDRDYNASLNLKIYGQSTLSH